jgi:hypothetical protein
MSFFTLNQFIQGLCGEKVPFHEGGVSSADCSEHVTFVAASLKKGEVTGRRKGMKTPDILARDCKILIWLD